MRLSGPHLPSNMFPIPQAEPCAARRGKTSSHPAHGRAGRDTHVPTEGWGWDVTPAPPASLAVTRNCLHLVCSKRKKRKKKAEEKGEKEEGKESQPVNHIHHYHNWLRSWLVDDWFMSSWCKPSKEEKDGNLLIYLSVIQQEALLNTGDPRAQADPREAALCLPQGLTWQRWALPKPIHTITPSPL